MLRKIMIVGAALGALVTAAVAGTVPYLSGASLQEPSQELATLNQMLQNINNSFGRLTSTGTQFATAAGTAEQIAAQYTIPPTLIPTTPGYVFRQKCWGTRANNTDVVTARLYFGAEVVSLTITASAATNWEIEGTTVTNGAAIQTTEWKATNGGAATAITETTGTDNTSSGTIVAKCTLQDGTSAANDGIMNGYLAEAVN